MNKDNTLPMLMKFSSHFLFVVLLLCCSASIAAPGALSGTKFLQPDQAFSHHEKATADGRIEITWDVAPGYYLYRSRMNVEGVPSPVAAIKKPEGKSHKDPYFGEQQIYEHNVSVIVSPGQAKELQLTWQGCAKAGLCYPPQHDTIRVADISGVGAQSAPLADHLANTRALTGSMPTENLSSEQALAASLAGGPASWTLLVFFGLGLLLAFTPCVLPMLPILSGVIVGAGARGLRGLVLSLAFVLPMAVTYAVLGVAAALAGAGFQAMLQTPLVLGILALIFAALAAAMFGAFDLQLPAGLRNRLNEASARRRGGYIGGAAILGVISAALVGPCMTAPLAGALLYIADSGNAVLGGLALLSLGLGMGLPLLVAGTLGAQLMPRPGPWMSAIKTFFGFVLLGTAIWLVGRVIPEPIQLGLWGALLVAVAVTLGTAARRAETPVSAAPLAATTLAIIGGLWGALLLVGSAGGAHNPLRPLEFLHNTPAQAQAVPNTARAKFTIIQDIGTLNHAVRSAAQNDRWTVVDFYADWCVSCKVIDRQVFGNPQVQSTLAHANLLRPDVTRDSPESRQLLQRLSVLGPPTILFIGPDGQERRGARIVGEIGADAFLDHWQNARSSR